MLSSVTITKATQTDRNSAVQSSGAKTAFPAPDLRYAGKVMTGIQESLSAYGDSGTQSIPAQRFNSQTEGTVQRIVTIMGHEDYQGQNAIRIWMNDLLKPHFNLPRHLANMAQPIRELLADPVKSIIVEDSLQGAVRLYNYLCDLDYSIPRLGEDHNMDKRREGVGELLDKNYPLNVAADLYNEELDGNVYDAFVDAVDTVTNQIRASRDVLARGRANVFEDRWKTRKSGYLSNLADYFYAIIAPQLAPKADERRRLSQRWIASGDDFLIELGTMFKSEPRAAAASDESALGLDPSQYATGAADDPIPFVFYKRGNQYPPTIDPKAGSDKPQLNVNAASDINLSDGTTVQIGGGAIFNSIREGEVLQDNAGHGSTRPVERKVRNALAKDYKLGGLDIDHIQDLGFGGTDTADNLWPLNSDINRRPVDGQWRTQYKLYFNKGGKVFKGAIGSSDLYHKHFVIRGYIAGSSANGVPAESDTPAAGKK